ncbi:MAG: DUF4190 domain-containing protein [Chloroflexi bacterium]|jgi:hypothetical protein|nr:DUF4190 domain-containing protein [Chloroflexota bacterium]
MSEYPPASTYQPVETNIWAIISVISGVLGWLGVFGLGGIAAVICGHVAKSQINNSAGRQGGDGLATIGLVLGYLNIALVLFGICLFVLITVGVISGAAVCPFIFGNTY